MAVERESDDVAIEGKKPTHRGVDIERSTKFFLNDRDRVKSEKRKVVSSNRY
jgi:hypothetical protein